MQPYSEGSFHVDIKWYEYKISYRKVENSRDEVSIEEPSFYLLNSLEKG